MDASDLFDIYGSDDALAKARADAMSRRAQAMQGTGLILKTLAGDRDPTGGALGTMGQHESDQAVAAIQHRPQAQLQAEQMRKAQIQNQAEASPEYAGAMRDLGYELGAPAGSLENVPGPALTHVIGPREKLAERRMMADIYGARQSMMGWQIKTLDSGQQVYVNTHTLETRSVGPDGAPGRQLSPPRLLIGGGRGAPAPAVPPAAPAAAPSADGSPPAPAPAAPRTPRLVDPTKPAAAAAPGGTAFYPLFGKQLDKANQAFGADLDPNGKGAGEIQKNQARLNAAIRLRKLVTNEDGTIKDMIPPQFMKETATALAQLVSNGGQPAQNLIEELTPKTGSSKVADLVQWVTAHPQDAGQQAFVKLYLESANREAQAAQEALNKAVSARVGKHQRLIKGNPDVARETAGHFGWDIDEKGNLVPRQPAAVASGAVEAAKPSPDDLAAMEWLKTHPDHPKAAGVAAKLKAKGL
jgi:hypothetical protein